MDAMHIFSSEEEETLIEHVKKYPCLYNYQSKDYKNVAGKTQAWITIADEMNKTEDVCKTKWKNIRDWYIRKRRDKKLPTGSTTVASLMRARFNRLKFLDGCDDSEYSNCNGSDVGDDSGDPLPFRDGHFISASLEEPEVVIREHVKPEIHPGDMYDDDDEHPQAKTGLRTSELLAEHITAHRSTLELLRELVKSLGAAKAPQSEDHLDKFFQGMAATVRNLPLSYQTEAKKRVATLILQLESDAVSSDQDSAKNSLPTNPAKRQKHK